MITDLMRRGDMFNLSPVFDVFDGFFPASIPHVSRSETSFKVDVKESEDSYIIEAELPSIKEEEVDINLDDGLLTISVEREECECDRDRYHIRERKCEKMSRGFRMPAVDVSSAEASLKDGILTVTVKKTPETRSQKVKIKSGCC